MSAYGGARMSVLQKQLLDVRLLGLDEKANPRTTQMGTIVDGRNWMITKEQRIEKRLGLGAAAMLDSTGATITGGRELSSHSGELLLNDGKKWYSSNPINGAWIPRGRAAYESLRILPAAATNAECNGVDSRLQMDTAQIGRYLLTFLSGGSQADDLSESGWMLSDATTGAILLPRQTKAFQNVSMGTDGHAAAPTFVGWGCSPSYRSQTDQCISMIIWDNTAGFATAEDRTTITDVALTSDQNSYSMPLGNQLTFPYAVVLVADNTWLIAYQQEYQGGSRLVVRKVTRTLGAGWNVTVSAATVVTSLYNSLCAIPISWSYTSGGTAYLAWEDQGDCELGESVMFAPINVSTGAVGTILNTQGDGVRNWDSCRSLSVADIGGTPWVFIDMIWHTVTLNNQRAVWLWNPSGATCSLLLNGAGLLTQAFTYAIQDTLETGIGIAYPSTWQPSAFLIRVRVSGSAPAGCCFGGHLQAGDFAGCPMALQLPHFAAGAALGIGRINNESSPGGSGTVIVAMASLAPATVATYPTQGQPVEISDTTVMPGAALKTYDGEHVTEAQFWLGPETLTVTAANTLLYLTNGGLQVAPGVYGVLTGTVAQGDFQFGAGATIFLSTPPGWPGAGPWGGGTCTATIYARMTQLPPGCDSGTVTLSLVMERCLATDPQANTTRQYALNANAGIVPIDGTWGTFTFTLPATAIPAGNASDVLGLFVGVSCDATYVGALLEVSTGGTQASTVSVPLSGMEIGSREYTAVAVWTDAQGRLQRSQPSPPVSLASSVPVSISVTIPMLSITERGTPFNLDANIQAAQIELYRTGVNDPIFYRVATIPNVINGDPVEIVDIVPDADITANEQLYTTGGAVEHWPVIGCNILASHQGRLFAATADNQVYFTAYLQSGEGLAFAAEYQIETEHINGLLTGLFSLDDKLVIATAQAYAPLSGIGPEATGVPAYDSPMLVGSGVGPRGPRCYVRTPDGIAMVTNHGVQLLDRGLSLQYIGQPTEIDVYAGATPWFAAAYHPSLNQIRLFRSALALVWDWTLGGPPGRAGQWMRWTYSPADIIATASVNGSLYYLGSDGAVYTVDTGPSDNGAAFQEWIQLAVTSPAGENAWGRIFAMRLACILAAGSTLKVIFTPEEGNLAITDTQTIVAGSGMTNVITKPRYGKCSSMTIWIGENAPSTTAGITLDAIGLLVGNKGGAGRMPIANRMSR